MGSSCVDGGFTDLCRCVVQVHRHGAKQLANEAVDLKDATNQHPDMFAYCMSTSNVSCGGSRGGV